MLQQKKDHPPHPISDLLIQEICEEDVTTEAGSPENLIGEVRLETSLKIEIDSESDKSDQALQEKESKCDVDKMSPVRGLEMEKDGNGNLDWSEEIEKEEVMEIGKSKKIHGYLLWPGMC